MAGSTGTKIVTDGLVLCLDAASIKSYPGLRSNPISLTWYDVTKSDGWFDTDAQFAFTEHSESTGFLLDGISNYGEQYVGYATSFDTTTIITGDVTVEVWFRISAHPASGYVRLFGKGTLSRVYGLWYRSSSFLWQRGDSSPGFTNTEYVSAPSLNTWYHMVGTSSGGNDHKLFLNGLEVASNSSTMTLTSTIISQRYTIGVYTTSNYHNGNIANIKLYNRALSAEEVQQNFNAHRGRFGI